MDFTMLREYEGEDARVALHASAVALWDVRRHPDRRPPELSSRSPAH